MYNMAEAYSFSASNWDSVSIWEGREGLLSSCVFAAERKKGKGLTRGSLLRKKEHDRDRLPGSLEWGIINRQGKMIKNMTSVQGSLKWSLPL